ncbi:MAG TPA: hypothetical protein VGB17_00920 [Pyrinomonadaceae bacterium]|jgi:hypothetical protein
MIISVINLTHGKHTDEEIQVAIRAINRQIAHDFEPYWSLTAELRLEGCSSPKPRKHAIADMRGDAVLYLWDEVDVDGALGYHERNDRGIPFGVVFTELSQEMGEHWSVTLSHEALELIGDPEVNLLVAGPHPSEQGRDVFHWYEMCDAVQAESYEIDGVMVSNFLLPLYFTGSEEKGGRNDFLGRLYDGKALKSFGVNPGGYIGFFDPQKQTDDTFAIEGDKRAQARQEVKGRARGARRSVRYQLFNFTGRTTVAEAVETLEEGASEPGSAGERKSSTTDTFAKSAAQASSSAKSKAAAKSGGRSKGQSKGSKAGKKR